MLSKEAKDSENFVCWFVNGGVGAGALCHGWLTFWVEKEGSLYYHFCVFVKAKKKIFFFLFSFLSEGSQSLESPYSPHFCVRVPSELRLPGRHLLGEVSVLGERERNHQGTERALEALGTTHRDPARTWVPVPGV